MFRPHLHRRFLIAIALGVAACALGLGLGLGNTDAALIGVDLFFVIYLAGAALRIRVLDAEGLAANAEDADEGIVLLVALALAAVGVSFWAIHQTLAGADHGLWLRPVLALGAVPLGWAVLHLVMAFHYAAVFYQDHEGSPAGGLDFAGDSDAPPDLWDFMYHSFTIGMTAQTSDTGVTTRRMRRVTLAHAAVSFFYNAVLIALAVNAAMSLSG